MFKWIKESLFGCRSEHESDPIDPPESYSDLLTRLRKPEVKPIKDNDISEPVISFLETVRKDPKRFKVGVDFSSYRVRSIEEIPDYEAYKIWDNKLDKGWYVRGSRWTGSSVFLLEYNGQGLKFCTYEHAFFLTSDEKEYLIKEISSIMNYRVERKAKLDKIRADRRIRDTRNKLKELYK